jgi:hypothetical protein
MSKSPEFKAWVSAKQRCYNKKHPKFPIYGGRGIGMSKEWRENFASFYRDMGPRPSPNHSIDRINSDRDYCKSNCRWATIVEQNNNTRKNTHIKLDGELVTIAQASRKLDINYSRFVKKISKIRAEQEGIVCLQSIGI